MNSAIRQRTGQAATALRFSTTSRARFPSASRALQAYATSSLIPSSSARSLEKAVIHVEPAYLTMSSLLSEVNDPMLEHEHVVALDPTVFKHPIRRDILHLCVVHYLDSLRQGTASTKTRAEVRGSGRKIRPQKGTGRARLGDGQSPMLRGGGVAFGPKPRDFSTKLNRKVIQMGMRVALSLKLREQRLGVVESLQWYTKKTALLNERLEALGWHKGTLFVSGERELPENLVLASRNLRGVDVRAVGDLRVYDMIKWRRLVLDVPAVNALELSLTKASPEVLQATMEHLKNLVASPAPPHVSLEP